LSAFATSSEPDQPAETESGQPLPQVKSLVRLLIPKLLSLCQLKSLTSLLKQKCSASATSKEPGQPAETESGQLLPKLKNMTSLLKPKVVSLCYKYRAWPAC
jgi:hypothetical protein